MTHKINVPKPSRYNKNSDIEVIALEFNKLYREKCDNKQGYPVDSEIFADFVLETSIIWENIDSPANTIVLARCHPDKRDNSKFVISLNEHHQNFFAERSDIHRAATSHEIAHIVLNHHEKMLINLTPSLFGEEKKEVPYLHSTKFNHNSLTNDEIKFLCQLALDGDEEVRDFLLRFKDKLEEEWMFWQAEHFAMCFLIPQDRLYEIFEMNYDFTNWRIIYSLANDFGVSGSMMANRLKKSGAIEINGKQINHGSLFKQRRLI